MGNPQCLPHCVDEANIFIQEHGEGWNATEILPQCTEQECQKCSFCPRSWSEGHDGGDDEGHNDDHEGHNGGDEGHNGGHNGGYNYYYEGHDGGDGGHNEIHYGLQWP